jgi:hypothetical protein
MALKKVWTDNSSISVSAGELYRFSCDIRIDSGQIMDFVQRIYPSATGLDFDDFELVVYATSASPVDTVINLKANYRPTSSGNINADIAVETNQLEDNVVFTLDNYSVEGPKCLAKYPTNQYNFIRWKSGQNLFLPLSTDFDTCGGDSREDIPNAYAEYFDRNRCKIYRPIITLDEELKFCLNQKIDENTAGLENLSIALINPQGETLKTGLGTVSLTTADPNGDVLVYGSYTPTLADELKHSRNYQLVIYNTVTEAILFVSNQLKFMDRDFRYQSVYLNYKNTSDINGYAYSELPVGFENKVRVQLTRIDRQPEIELTQYQEASTGKVRNQKTQAKKTLTLQAYFFDDYAHDAMLSLSLHDGITINSRVMEVKTAYSIETNVRSNTDHGTIELYDQAYSTVNLAGNSG